MENFIFCAVPLEGNNKKMQNEYTHFVTTTAAILLYLFGRQIHSELGTSISLLNEINSRSHLRFANTLILYDYVASQLLLTCVICS